MQIFDFQLSETLSIIIQQKAIQIEPLFKNHFFVVKDF